MRPAILVLSAILMLEACSTSLAPVLPEHRPNAPSSAPVAALDRMLAVATTSLAAKPAAASHDAVAAASPAIDLGTLAQIVARLPHDLYRFEIDLFICAGAVVAIGIVNAFLIASLLATRRHDAGAAHPSDGMLPLPQVPVTRAEADLETTAVLEPESVLVPVPVAVAMVPEEAMRSCTCGAAIGARSKTGRCRRCATASRTKRPSREVSTASA